MKATSKKPTSSTSAKGSGTVQIAIWKDNPDLSSMQSGSFYDFAKPLRLLDSPGWSNAIRAGSQEGFFVFSTDEKYFY